MTEDSQRELRLVVVTAGVSDPSSSRLLAERITGKTLKLLRESGMSASASLVELAQRSQMGRPAVAQRLDDDVVIAPGQPLQGSPGLGCAVAGELGVDRHGRHRICVLDL